MAIRTSQKQIFVASFLQWCFVAWCPLASYAQAAPLTLYQRDGHAMGTTVELHVYAASQLEADALFTDAFAEIERIEQMLSTYRPTSLVSDLNARADDEAVTVLPAFARFLGRTLAWSASTDGAFDPTVGALVQAWGFFRGEGRYPTNDELTEARAQTGWQQVQFDLEARTVRFIQRGIRLDFGGNGKGYAIDRVQQRWRQQGVTAGLVVMGNSSIYAIGAPPEQDGWRIAIPAVGGTERLVLLRDQAMATSGGAHKYFELDGQRYIHILDPRTGHPVQGRVQVSVAAPTAEAADVLSTALFVLGPGVTNQLLAAAHAGAFFVEGVPDAAREVSIRWCEQVPCRHTASDPSEQ